MNACRSNRRLPLALLPVVLVAAPGSVLAQAPVSDDGQVLEFYEPDGGTAATGNDGIPLLSAHELDELVGPIALYPDDLLAIVLPASTYPLQVVEAARFLEALEEDPSLKPESDWDDSVVALINYPEVVELLNEDLDWTWRLGEAVVAQQQDVLAAVESFRDRAYAAGNLKSDSYQRVERHDDGALEITPVAEDVIYVPYYEPQRVLVYQSRPVYHYYPRPCPVYYYPYPRGYAFSESYFWGVTSAFTIGWQTDALHILHSSFYGHPYFGHHYWDHWWYRRPPISVHNNYYVTNDVPSVTHRYRYGDYWRPRTTTRLRISDQRITRNQLFPPPRTRSAGSGDAGFVSERARSSGPADARQRWGAPPAARHGNAGEGVATTTRPPRDAAGDRREAVDVRRRATTTRLPARTPDDVTPRIPDHLRSPAGATSRAPVTRRPDTPSGLSGTRQALRQAPAPSQRRTIERSARTIEPRAPAARPSLARPAQRSNQSRSLPRAEEPRAVQRSEPARAARPAERPAARSLRPAETGRGGSAREVRTRRQ